MSSTIEGYNYDIFISYRQKDNKGDRWVSEFVDALKTELESTFKEEISVYFDINPHDGLLETHDVDASLKDKLKCLVFIPIISRTYCDPKSFAWEHEFKVFVEQASQDQFGLKVKLSGGNVANRILPIQIHDLKPEDKSLVEKELGGFLRAIEFIYKESGVNRPLTPKDSEDKNTNKTNYRNQINKVANAIDETLSGLKSEPLSVEKESSITKEPLKEIKKRNKIELQEKPVKTSKMKLLSGVGFLLILIIAGIFAYQKIFKRNSLDKLRSSGERISIAVMPFHNMTNDTTLNVWQNEIQDILITSLSNSEELSIRPKESVNSLIKSKGLSNYAPLTSSYEGNLAKTLNANVFISGSITKSGSILRLNAQVNDAKTIEILKSFQIESHSAEGIEFSALDSLSASIYTFIAISNMIKINLDFSREIMTTSPRAYKYFVLGRNAYSEGDYGTAIEWWGKALDIDSNFTNAESYIITGYLNSGMYEDARGWFSRYYKKKGKMTLKNQLWAERKYAQLYGTPYDENKQLLKLKQLNDLDPMVYYNLGLDYINLNEFEKSIPEFEKAIEIYDKWGSKPMSVGYYYYLGIAYHKTEHFDKEKGLYKKAEEDFPDNPLLISGQAILALSEGKIKEANDYIEKYRSELKKRSTNEVDLLTNLASIYSKAEMPDKAELYFRQAFLLVPDSLRINNLAYFLIDKDRNIPEGLELIEKALEVRPYYYSYLHTKGWGLYKQGKYKEALEILQKSWDLRMKNAIYYHEAFLHLEETRKAVAGFK